MEEEAPEAPIDRLFSLTRLSELFRGSGKVSVPPRLQPVILVGRNIDSATQTFDSIIDSNARLMVNPGTAGVSPGAAFGESISQPADSTDAAVTIGAASQDWEIASALWSGLMSATVVSRTWLGRHEFLGRTFVGVVPVIDGTAVTLSASETGSQEKAAWPSDVLDSNDAGTHTITTGNVPLPARTGSSTGGLTVVCTSLITVNKQVGDRTGVSVMARRVA